MIFSIVGIGIILVSDDVIGSSNFCITRLNCSAKNSIIEADLLFKSRLFCSAVRLILLLVALFASSILDAAVAGLSVLSTFLTSLIFVEITWLVILSVVTLWSTVSSLLFSTLVCKPFVEILVTLAVAIFEILLVLVKFFSI